MSWFQNFDFLSLSLGAGLGAVLSTWHGHFVKRPLLSVSGGGGGGNGEFRQNHVGIQNGSGLLGIRIGQTSILGFNIHRRVEYGLIVDRAMARDCTAYIFDKRTKRPIKPLWWNANGAYTRTVSLSSGERANLMVFSAKGKEKKYFIFDVNPHDGKITEPDDDIKFEGSRSFLIKVRCGSSKQVLEIDASVVLGFDGRLEYYTGDHGGSF